MNEIYCKKFVAYLLMITSCLMGVYGYKALAGTTDASTGASKENSDVQWNGYLETTKNGPTVNGTEKTGNDLRLPSQDGGPKKQDGVRDTLNARPNKLQESNDGGINERHEIPVGHTIRHNGYSTDSYIQDEVQYAYEVGGMNLVELNECENGERDMNRIGDGGKAYGLCQAQLGQHPEIDSDKFKTDRKYQIDECRKLRKGGTPFFGPERNNEHTDFKDCYKFVEKRFTLANQM